MTEEELIAGLAHARANVYDRAVPDYSEDEAHRDADALLIAYINDERVKAAFDAIPKWYS